MHRSKAEDYHTELYWKLGDLSADFRNSNLIDLVASHVSGERVLDIGSGTGWLLRKLKDKGKIVYGIEPNKKLVKLAKKFNPDILIHVGSGDKIDKIKQPVDTITMIDVLEHIKDDKTQLRKFYKKLAPGGQVVIVVPAYPSLYGIRDKNNGHYRRYSKKELITKLTKEGFIIRKIRYWNMLGFLPYLFYEKVLHKELSSGLRSNTKGILRRTANKLFNGWFKYIENPLNVGFGLSLICIAEKPGREYHA